jgi:hypothetical protein
MLVHLLDVIAQFGSPSTNWVASFPQIEHTDAFVSFVASVSTTFEQVFPSLVTIAVLIYTSRQTWAWQSRAPKAAKWTRSPRRLLIFL